MIFFLFLFDVRRSVPESQLYVNGCVLVWFFISLLPPAKKKSILPVGMKSDYTWEGGNFFLGGHILTSFPTSPTK